MSPLQDEYEREATYAMDMADKSPTEALRAQWLRLARKWLDMLPHRERTAKNKFDAAVRHNGTGQTDSGASH
jgi:hypothetical protein